jgi:putative transcriptional regulator
MAIIVKLDILMAVRKIKLVDLAERIGITNANLSLLKQNKVRAMRFSTLEKLCRELECQPGDLIEYVPDNADPPSDQR